MTRSEAQEVLENRLEQMESLVRVLMLAGEQADKAMTVPMMAGALWSVLELIEQARAAFGDTLGQDTPELPGPDGPEPIDDLETESLTLLREMTNELDGVSRLGRTLLDAVDKVRKAA